MNTQGEYIRFKLKPDGESDADGEAEDFCDIAGEVVAEIKSVADRNGNSDGDFCIPL